MHNKYLEASLTKKRILLIVIKPGAEEKTPEMLPLEYLSICIGRGKLSRRFWEVVLEENREYQNDKQGDDGKDHIGHYYWEEILLNRTNSPIGVWGGWKEKD